MYYIVYKTTNLINRKTYIGIHSSTEKFDSYLGSGIGLREDIQKYGKQFFQRENLFIYNNPMEMLEKEKELVNEDFVNDPQTYNRIIGGNSPMELWTTPVIPKNIRKTDCWNRKPRLLTEHEIQLMKNTK